MPLQSHTPSESGRVNYISEHLRGVADRAAEYASAFGASEEAGIAGLLHDLGKYGDLFQRRLRNEVRGIDHWSAGAWLALTRYKARGIAIALCIQGHHLGLQRADKDSLAELDISKLYEAGHEPLKLSEKNLEKLIKCFQADGFALPESLPPSICSYDKAFSEPSSQMLNIRMLFSALADADFIETEAHFNSEDGINKCYRREGQPLDPSKALELLTRYIDRLKPESSSDKMIEMRSKLRQACLAAAECRPGLFTLTAPTGSGKTLSMLAFALRHAQVYGKRRIIVVLPYLSIIEQTAGVYREIFSRELGEDFIIENHSLAGKKDLPDENDLRIRLDYLAENWDAPIVITTSVQFLESLHSNRPSACRKLHRLADSVVLLDEVQTLPSSLAVPTLSTLSALSERFGATVVFSTATQPAFSHLHDDVKNLCAAGWRPAEIVPEELNLFNIVKRTSLIWKSGSERLSWDDLAGDISTNDRALCIVNIKRHALDLYDKLTGIVSGCVYHISTNMCPAHRKDKLAEVNGRLTKKQRCILVSTQCVEAGVDIDFPVVYRAVGPLDSIAQASGRCNRNGELDTGLVVLFKPEDERYPDGAYQQATTVTNMLFNQSDDKIPDLDDPGLFERYYKELYSFSRPGDRNRELREAIKRLDFADAAKHYRLIRTNTINIIVPYNKTVYERLKKEAEARGIRGKWIKEARPYAISAYMPRDDDPIRNCLEPAHPDYDKRPEAIDERWYFYTDASHYDASKGLIPAEDHCTIA
jgi:CRISPR-associated endonuclease/helicase Cas3